MGGNVENVDFHNFEYESSSDNEEESCGVDDKSFGIDFDFIPTVENQMHGIDEGYNNKELFSNIDDDEEEHSNGKQNCVTFR